MNGKRIADGFDSCLQSEGNGLHRLCFLLVRDPREAEEVAFQALLRLAARKENDPRDDRTLLYSAALRLSSDWFGRKLRKAPREDALRDTAYYPLDNAMLSLLRRPFSTRAAAGLSAAGFSEEEIRKLAGSRTAQALARIPEEEMEAARKAFPWEDRIPLLSDRVYDRFSERSVPVENAIHEARIRFDRLSPILAVLVLLFFFFCVWFAGRNG